MAAPRAAAGWGRPPPRTARRLQAGLQTIRTDISECRRNISDASKKIVAEEEKVAQRIQTFASGGYGYGRG